MKKFTLIWCIIFLLTVTLSYPHPGGTDGYGCHTCRTNCIEKYGIPYGFYHRHNPVRPCFDGEESKPTPIEKPIITCPSGWKCKDTNYKGYQLSNCSWISLEYCKEGCENDNCKVAPPPEPPSSTPPPTLTLPAPTPPTPPKIEVSRVIDGDTFVLTNWERVRLIGIDSAEVGQCYYLEAKNKLEDLIQGKEIRLEKDISERDKYDRLLGYIYVNNLFINYELVRQGYARAYRYKPDVRFADKFQEAEGKAKEEKLGLWSKCFPSSDQDKISAPITAKVIEEEIEAVTTISKPTIKPNETKKTIPKFVMQKNQTNETKVSQRQVITTPSKKEKGFFKSVTSWFLNLFR